MSRLCVNFWSPATLLRSLTVCRLPTHRQLATLAFLRLVDAVTNFWSIGRGHFGRWDFCSVYLFATLTHYKSVTTSVSWIFVVSCQDKRVCNSKPLSRPLLWSKGVSCLVLTILTLKVSLLLDPQKFDQQCVFGGWLVWSFQQCWSIIIRTW